MADKKISELPVASSISPSDVSVLVGTDTDYQFSFTTMLSFVSENLSVGSQNSFGTTIPQNNTGNNGDVFLKTDTATFYQKVNGTWTLVYTVPTGSISDGTLLYGIGTPGNIIGVDNDSYIDTNSGIFYLKTSGNWAQVFSMATGPQGPQGIAGTNGTNGLNGNTILNGTTNPSNTVGINGDFYLNLSNFNFFGPKTAGAWPAGTSIIGNDGVSSNIEVPFGQGTPVTMFTINWQTDIPPGQTVTYAALLGNTLPKYTFYFGTDSSSYANNNPQLTITRTSGLISTITIDMGGIASSGAIIF